jgi:hypothetical protein
LSPQLSHSPSLSSPVSSSVNYVIELLRSKNVIKDIK